jgi:predicted amino acid racemase
MVPLLLKEQIPKGINHFRVGESFFLGNDLFNGNLMEGMRDDVFELHSEIIEITEKPKVPYGEIQDNPSGDQAEFEAEDYGKKQKRAILDIGLLDISKTEFLKGANENLEFIGASSDMLVVDVTDSKKNYKVGDSISFKMNYMGALRVMNSRYIRKRLVD